MDVLYIARVRGRLTRGGHKISGSALTRHGRVTERKKTAQTALSLVMLQSRAECIPPM